MSFLNIFFLLLGFQQPQDSTRQIILKEIEIEGEKLEDRQTFKQSRIESHIIEENLSANLGDLLTLETPIFIKSYGAGGAQTVSFRGTGASHTQVYWNGINLNSPMLGQVDLSLFPVAFSDEIKVDYGASSLLYGTGGLGGAIHMNNRVSFGKISDLRLTQSIGSFSEYVTSGSYSKGNDKWQSVTKFYYKTAANDFKYWNISQSSEPVKMTNINAEQNQYGLSQEWHYQLNNGDRIGYRFWGQYNDRNLPPSTTVPDSYGWQQDAAIRNLIDFERKRDDYLLTANFAHMREFTSYKDNKSGIDSKSMVDIFQANVRYSYQWFNTLCLRAGANATLDIANSDNYDEPNKDETIRRTQSKQDIYGEIEYIPNPAWSISLLGRQQWIDGDLKPTLPSLGIRYFKNRIMDWEWGLRGNISRNFHAPSLNDRYWWPVGNPDLLPEEGWEGEIAFQLQKNKEKTNFSSETTLFFSYINNWIIWQPGVFNLWRPENITLVFSRGIEQNFQYNIQTNHANHHFFLNIAYTKAENQKPKNDRDVSVGKQLIYTPMYSLQAYYRLSLGKWKFTVEETAYGKRFTKTDETQYLPAYFLTNVVLSKDLNWKNQLFNAQLRVNNLFNYHYQSVAYKPMPPRNFLLTLTYYLQ
ncbi:TonB-dependent receptor [Persicobacter diffluens]|uniref:TonB-dependent receptor n=1 Tax=Persicobacter diffluens TaxID=981 RepID=A0AAN4W298_9BACT|nr:TonB-dependent receptor [Persicobacter diffluens]